MTPAQQAEPLPECRGCETPTRRDVWTGSGGLCTPCQDATRREAARHHHGLIPLFGDAQ